MGKMKKLTSMVLMTCMLFTMTCTSSASTLNTSKAGQVSSASCQVDSAGRLTARWGGVAQVRAAQMNGYYLVQVFRESSKVFETKANYLDTFKLCCSMTRSTNTRRYPYYAVITPFVRINGILYNGLGRTTGSVYRY